ncbi:MAG: A/G-specific adenine glycosylase [Acidimicrobiales bacterium]|nr:A/G-specific adenine glycosylase [Acidimicrobiales bacterium]
MDDTGVPAGSPPPALVIDWWERAKRDLPWRRTRDPWAVLVSELMLQQTQAPRVAPRYRAFLARFPTPAACAGAGPGDVLSAWAGLGYNRRAVSLHRAAVLIVERHGGRVPADLESLVALPGVGPYTARAVQVFAFGQGAGVVETNTARVLARAVAGRRLGPGEAQALADRLAPAGRSWEWNQALVDLGSLVCRSRKPACHECPLSGRYCSWHAAGRSTPDPARGSAGVSGRQSRFAGSDREGRGRLVAAARRGGVAAAGVALAAGWPEQPDRAVRVADQLVAEGLLRRAADGGLVLP